MTGPFGIAKVPPTAGPDRLDPHERMRIRTAAFEAKRRYPGPIGELVQRELLAHEEFGYRTRQDGLMGRLVAELSRPPVPRKEAPDAVPVQ
jgi:hypothetical protein